MIHARARHFRRHLTRQPVPGGEGNEGVDEGDEGQYDDLCLIDCRLGPADAHALSAQFIVTLGQPHRSHGVRYQHSACTGYDEGDNLRR